MNQTSMGQPTDVASVIPGTDLGVSEGPGRTSGLEETPGREAETLTGHQCGTSTDAQDWTHLNPWPALVRWWRRRHRIFWIPTEAKRPRLTRAIVEAGVRSPEMMTWALDYRDWTRSRQVWRMALLLASLLAVEMLVGGGVEAPRQTGAAPMSYSGKDAY